MLTPPSWEQIAWLDTETGETGERKLVHADGEAERFYPKWPPPAWITCYLNRTYHVLPTTPESSLDRETTKPYAATQQFAELKFHPQGKNYHD